MKYISVCILLLSALLLSCTKNKASKITYNKRPIDTTIIDTPIEIPNITLDKSLLSFNHKVSLWLINEHPYSGYAVSYYQDSTLKEKMGILNGRKQNQTKYWYADGNLKQIANYERGKLHGEKKVWSSEAVLLSHLNYQSGKPHGEQKTWYPTGELHKKLTLNRGREEGMQQAFRKNGVLYANYEAKEGRIFGLKKASLCYGLDSENLHFGK